jgi:hypothetical protein
MVDRILEFFLVYSSYLESLIDANFESKEFD